MRFATVVCALAFAGAISACGGGGGTKTPTSTASSQASSPTISPTRASATQTAAAATPTVAAAAPTAAEASTATPAPAATIPPAPPATEAPPPPAPTEVPPPPPPPPASGNITISALNLAFSTSALSAPAGTPITVTLQNNDSAIAHNIHFFAGNTNAGASIGGSDIIAGPDTVTLSLGALSAGTYFYQCDVHPTQMTGHMTVG